MSSKASRGADHGLVPAISGSLSERRTAGEERPAAVPYEKEPPADRVEALPATAGHEAVAFQVNVGGTGHGSPSPALATFSPILLHVMSHAVEAHA